MDLPDSNRAKGPITTDTIRVDPKHSEGNHSELMVPVVNHFNPVLNAIQGFKILVGCMNTQGL